MTVILSSPSTVGNQGGINERKDEFTKCGLFSPVFSILAVDSSGKLWVVIYGMERSKDRAPKRKLSLERTDKKEKVFSYVATSLFYCLSPSKEFLKKVDSEEHIQVCSTPNNTGV